MEYYFLYFLVQMTNFPLDPCLSKMLVNSEQLRCANEMLTIVALLSSPPVYARYVHIIFLEVKLMKKRLGDLWLTAELRSLNYTLILITLN